MLCGRGPSSWRKPHTRSKVRRSEDFLEYGCFQHFIQARDQAIEDLENRFGMPGTSIKGAVPRFADCNLDGMPEWIQLISGAVRGINRPRSSKVWLMLGAGAAYGTTRGRGPRPPPMPPRTRPPPSRPPIAAAGLLFRVLSPPLLGPPSALLLMTIPRPCHLFPVAG